MVLPPRAPAPFPSPPFLSMASTAEVEELLSHQISSAVSVQVHIKLAGLAPSPSGGGSLDARGGCSCKRRSERGGAGTVGSVCGTRKLAMQVISVRTTTGVSCFIHTRTHTHW